MPLYVQIHTPKITFHNPMHMQNTNPHSCNRNIDYLQNTFKSSKMVKLTTLHYKFIATLHTQRSPPSHPFTKLSKDMCISQTSKGDVDCSLSWVHYFCKYTFKSKLLRVTSSNVNKKLGHGLSKILHVCSYAYLKI